MNPPMEAPVTLLCLWNEPNPARVNRAPGNVPVSWYCSWERPPASPLTKATPPPPVSAKTASKSTSSAVEADKAREAFAAPAFALRAHSHRTEASVPPFSQLAGTWASTWRRTPTTRPAPAGHFLTTCLPTASQLLGAWHHPPPSRCAGTRSAATPAQPT